MSSRKEMRQEGTTAVAGTDRRSAGQAAVRPGPHHQAMTSEKNTGNGFSTQERAFHKLKQSYQPVLKTTSQTTCPSDWVWDG